MNFECLMVDEANDDLFDRVDSPAAENHATHWLVA
jgi:hypothetical protein